jgi:hypothetical protein
MSMDGFPVTRKPVDPRQEKILFDDFLDINVMSVRGRTYSPRDIIERLANKAGGAHWDPKHYAEMMLPGPASSMFNQVQLHIARVAFSLGREILKSLVDIELHATVYARPEEGSEKGTFIDFKMPNSPTRLRFGYDREYKPKLLITGYDGKSLTVRVEPLIDWQLPHHWGLIHTITDDLKSHLAIEVDGIIEGEVEAQLPVLTSSDSLQYDMYLNRSHSNEVSDTVTALAMIDLFKRDLSSTERAKKLLHFEEFRLNVDEYYSVIPKGEHGHAPYGSNDITFTERTRRKLKDLLDV